MMHEVLAWLAGELGGALSNARNKRFALMEIRQAVSNLRVPRISLYVGASFGAGCP